MSIIGNDHYNHPFLLGNHIQKRLVSPCPAGIATTRPMRAYPVPGNSGNQRSSFWWTPKSCTFWGFFRVCELEMIHLQRIKWYKMDKWWLTYPKWWFSILVATWKTLKEPIDKVLCFRFVSLLHLRGTCGSWKSVWFFFFRGGAAGGLLSHGRNQNMHRKNGQVNWFQNAIVKPMNCSYEYHIYIYIVVIRVTVGAAVVILGFLVSRWSHCWKGLMLRWRCVKFHLLNGWYCTGMAHLVVTTSYNYNRLEFITFEIFWIIYFVFYYDCIYIVQSIHGVFFNPYDCYKWTKNNNITALGGPAGVISLSATSGRAERTWWDKIGQYAGDN